MSQNDEKNSAAPQKAADGIYERSFFGRRKGLKLSPRQDRLLDGLYPKLALDPTTTPYDTMESLFAKAYKDARYKAYRMEIGFGGGEHLIHQAKLNPDIGFIGVEPFVNGMAKILGQIERERLTNIRLFSDDATLLIDWLPKGEMMRVDLLYPDPWPKKRHWKRRFVGQKNLSLITNLLHEGAEFRFASDIDTYINWTLSHVKRHGVLTWQAEKAADWHEPWENWTRTRYEAKAIREGRPPAYLIFKK